MGFPFLIANLSSLPIEHLQMDSKSTDALRRRGIATIGELVVCVGNERYATQEGLTALAALEELARVSGPRSTDWYAFWERRNFVFHHQMLTCTELENFDRSNPCCPIGKENFGNAGAMLARAGFDTLGALAAGFRSGLPQLPGMGNKKLAELMDTLMALVSKLRSGELRPEDLAQSLCPTSDAVEVAGTPEAFALLDATKELGIGVLHLGTKTRILKHHGIHTVGDVVEGFPGRLRALDGLGRTTVSVLSKSLEALVASQVDGEGVDWDRFTKLLEIPLLPLSGEPLDGHEFVTMVGDTISAVGRLLDDPVLQLIISKRLSRLPHERSSLEEVGSAQGVGLTRERIRQKEEKFLSALAAALVSDDYSDLTLHFRPGFASFWKRAAARFADVEEVDFDALVNVLTEVWSVERELLLEHFPFIATVITGDVPAGTTLGDAARLDSRILNAAAAVREVPLKRLQLSRSARALAGHGIDTVGQLVDKVRVRAISRKSGTHFKNAIDHLAELACCIRDNGTVDWQAYEERSGAPRLPTTPCDLPSDFITHIVPSVSEILEHAPPTTRAGEIFKLRTSRPMMTRLTTDETAKRLGTYGPSVKREETDALHFLNEVLIGRDYALAKAELAEGFLKYWSDAVTAFEQVDGDSGNFKTLLATQWGVAENAVEVAMPTFVAILTGYPYGRLGRYSRLKLDHSKVVVELPAPLDPQIDMPVKIVLRGFRRQH